MDERLRNRVLRQDGWKCRWCGTMSNPEVHSNEFRSPIGHFRGDLITLCAACHAGIAVFPSLVCSEEELRELDAEYSAEGQRAYYPTADVKGIACAYARAQEDQGSGMAGGSESDQASFRSRSAEMALMGKVSIDSTRRRMGG
jgi:hypothetical protein